MAANKIDLNADMGESALLWHYDLEQDIKLLDQISSMNLACGYHAGDPDTMQLLIDKALDKQVAIGAHPSYPDREYFGRRSMDIATNNIYDAILVQLDTLQKISVKSGTRLHHVKPHGALYNDAAFDADKANAIIDAIVHFDPDLILYGLSGSPMIRLAVERGLRIAHEVFADRSYQPDGTLTPRTFSGAVISEPEMIRKQVAAMIVDNRVTTFDGMTIDIKADTLCIHSDTPGALELATAINKLLYEKGVKRCTI